MWGFPVKIEMDCQALRDVIMSDDLNATHARWRDGILAHQITDACHIPGHINLIGDGISCKDKDLPHKDGDGSSWSVPPDWKHACSLQYDLFSVKTVVDTVHSKLHDRFKNENIFLEVVDALLGTTGASSDPIANEPHTVQRVISLRMGNYGVWVDQHQHEQYTDGNVSPSWR